jgi:hypothetical protein
MEHRQDARQYRQNLLDREAPADAKARAEAERDEGAARNVAIVRGPPAVRG